MNFDRDFFKLMNSVAFGKTMENIKKNRYIKLFITERRRSYLYESQIIILQSFSEKNSSNRNEKK